MLLTPWFRAFQQSLTREWSRGFSTQRRSRRRMNTVSRLESLEDRSLPSATMIDIVAGAGASNPQGMTDVNGLCYFSATYPGLGTELWMSDGTPGGTAIVADIVPGLGGSYPSQLINVDGTLYFTANNADGNELWMFDGTTLTEVDIRTGPTGSNPYSLTDVNGTLFFTANDGNGMAELWKSNGTFASTMLVKSIQFGISGSITELTNVNGVLFFRAAETMHGSELWKSDGTPGGTNMVKDIFVGGASFPSELTDVNGTLYFGAASGNINGVMNTELWKSDGTALGTVLVVDINALGASTPVELTNVNGTLYFSADDGVNGRELWKSDAMGTTMVKNINLTPTVAASSNPKSLTNVNGTLFFTAIDGTNGVELWKSNGTSALTMMVKNINTAAGASSNPMSLTNVGGTLYFAASNGTSSPNNGIELWRSDGTISGTALVQDIRPGTMGSNSASLAIVNLMSDPNMLFFSANNGTNGVELWTLCTAPPTIAPIFLGNSLLVFGDDCDNSITVYVDSGIIKIDYGLGVLTTPYLASSITSISLIGKGGNDYLKFDSSLGTGVLGVLIGGAGNDMLFGGVGKDTYLFDTATQLDSDTVMDASGIDTLDFSPCTLNVTVNLGTTAPQTVNSNLKLKLTSAILIENAIGGSGNDILKGSVIQNSLVGGAGSDVLMGFAADDTLTGGMGNDSLIGGPNNDTYLFDTSNQLNSDTVMDASGIDLLDFSASANNVNVDLSLAPSHVYNSNLTLMLSSATSIENATGGMGNDVLIGNTLGNVLIGGPGRDTLTGAAGNDTLSGGDSRDVLTGGLGSDSLTGGDDNDNYFFDMPTVMETDTVVEQAGIAVAGFDSLRFDSMTSNVTVNLGISNFIATMPLRNVIAPNLNIEGVYTGCGNDSLTGDAAPNTLDGGCGNDTLTGLGGNDAYQFEDPVGSELDTVIEASGGGIDTLDFHNLTIPVTVDLTSDTMTAKMGTSPTRTVITGTAHAADLEGLVGGKANDTLSGNGADNSFDGRGGDDLLIGGIGDDAYDFVDPSPTIPGGMEMDTVVELPNQGRDTVYFYNTTLALTVDLSGTVNPPNVVAVTMVTGRTVFTGSGSLPTDFENAFGGSANDTLIGNASDNLLVGYKGNDNITGGDGKDVLVGGQDADSLDGGNDEDLVIAGYTQVGTNRVDSFSFLKLIVQSAWITSLSTSSLVPGTNVFDDMAVDTLNSADGIEDWLFVTSNDAYLGTSPDSIDLMTQVP